MDLAPSCPDGRFRGLASQLGLGVEEKVVGQAPPLAWNAGTPLLGQPGWLNPGKRDKRGRLSYETR